MAMRVTGMYSGLDTETIVQELVAARQTKVDDLKKEQTKLEWKQTAWKDLNNKISKLFTGTLDNLVYQSSYMKKKTTSSNDNLVSVITKDTAMDSVQELEIKKLAKAGYLTGGVIKDKDGNKVTSGSKLVDKLGIASGSKFAITAGGKTVDITVDENTTINDVVSKLQSAGVKASFDSKNQRLFIGSEGTGAANDFTIIADNSDGLAAMEKLGILTYGSGGDDDQVLAAYKKWAEMSDDDKNAAISARAAELLKSYTAERSSLEKEVNNLDNKQDALIEEFKKEFADSTLFDDVTAPDFTDKLRARIAELKQAQTDAEAIINDENATADEKSAAQEALDKAKSELSYLEGYQSNASAIETKKNRIDELNQDYINADGTAGTKTMEEATAYIEDRISQAQDMVNNYAAKKAAYESKPANERAVKTDGQDAEILLNGATFTADSNTFEINGLTITCKGLTTGGEKITLTTENDVSGIYDMIKGFIKEYGELINEMDKLYNADSAKGYDPLTDDEKDSMSESEVEKWETKIKDSLLRRDSTLNTVSSAMKEIMASGFSVNGKTMYLSDFGIETLGYFTAADNEKNAYHINGDADDDNVKSKTNTLQEMISTDPDSVVSFFTQLGKSMNAKLKSLRGRTEFSSINTVYDDKKMKEEYDNYTTKIKEAEEKLQDYEDKWYKKFSAMETALAKLQSNSSAVTSLLGGS